MMKSPIRFATVFCMFGVATALAQVSGTSGMQMGNPGMKSIGPLAFGPDGILLAADTRSAAVVAIATGDTRPGDPSAQIAVEGIDAKVASLLGTSTSEILINDVAVNPISRQAYLAVSRGRSFGAQPVLVRVSLDGQLSIVSLDNVSYSRASFSSIPADDPNARTNPRSESITDMAFVDGKVIVAGLANEEFASTLRTIPYPFTSEGSHTSVEIYHGNHGRYETRAPIRTFTSITEGDHSRLLAAYTCTPLVDLAMDQLTPGSKVMGKTIADLGNGNQPLDMIVYQKDGKNYLLMSNSSRGVMKIGIDNLDKTESITSRVEEEKRFENLSYEDISAWTGIAQLDRLDSTHALVLHDADGSMNLETRALP